MSARVSIRGAGAEKEKHIGWVKVKGMVGDKVAFQLHPESYLLYENRELELFES